MPDVSRHPEAGSLGAWTPACAGMTDSYTVSEFALGQAATPAAEAEPEISEEDEYPVRVINVR